ncbi:succinate dehydrogenase, hydrophobic membrane anchor protein [Marinibactrum halimedae]|uniref:Succinate dehydrogenase hydrophobic membrane anchor subunit n=1 Tax=Marinibactrum halimedae TaxID=1444977 RepID=A0AA37T2V7_9GAMM|nr:succinate dehydrogenase, hydrophobic membrane anchor protein [Marinibactrum halimedae]MCD9458670.1 succinate dehydrogenase, hydrophobic membrane anchor protein [Marinibactrum halimedae]GLS25964.1 succinate dehydrogenase hydrophobic membrane anchor subunit [Marinibactrum halimedae]
MVTAVTSFGRSGLYDWLIQRVSAVVLAAYTLFMVAYLVLNPDLTYTQWQGLFDQLWMRIFSFVTLISIVAHAWIGLWSVLTDYLTSRMMGGKAVVLRVLAQVCLGVVAVTYTIWGIEILWGL